MELATIIAFGIGFFAGGATIGAFFHINGQDWGEPEKPDEHADIDYADIPAFLRRQAD